MKRYVTFLDNGSLVETKTPLVFSGAQDISIPNLEDRYSIPQDAELIVNPHNEKVFSVTIKDFTIRKSKCVAFGFIENKNANT